MLNRIVRRGAPQLLLVSLAVGCVQQEPSPPEGARAAPREADAAQPAPKIACAKPVEEFGTVTQGATVERTFTIKNTGRGVLRIDRAQGG